MTSPIAPAAVANASEVIYETYLRKPESAKARAAFWKRMLKAQEAFYAANPQGATIEPVLEAWETTIQIVYRWESDPEDSHLLRKDGVLECGRKFDEAKPWWHRERRASTKIQCAKCRKVVGLEPLPAAE